ncbi:hypothetical protein NESM_000851200 [Novymonas esmeraldas]|uniref:Uncharacterized protein n=1 Tax=Novymonas esmeraldas TaxID=1808958 RepID=A0AAW0F0D0_9TRYP
MDAGHTLDELLARHEDYVSAAPHAAPGRGHRRRGSRSSATPPPRLVEALERGVNPLMVGTQAHTPESAAREKAKAKRREPSAARPMMQRAAACCTGRRTTTASSAPTSETRAGLTPVPRDRDVQRAREATVSAGLASRHRELRARQLGDEAGSPRRRSAATPSPRSDVGGEGALKRQRVEMERPPSLPGAAAPYAGATVATHHRRRAWRRCCTTRKIVRLSRGVTRAAALRRYWYAAPVHVTAPPSGAPAVCDTAMERCAQRRLRAARRTSADAHTRARRTRRQVGPPAPALAPAPAPAAHAAVGGPSAAAQPPPAARRTGTGPTSRSERKARVRELLRCSATRMWRMAAGVVAERRDTLCQLRHPSAGALVSGTAAAATTTAKAGVLPLTLARLFPLFGAVAEMLEVRLVTAPTRPRACQPAWSAPQLHVVQRRLGVIVEEYSRTVGLLLLPSQCRAEMQAWSDAVAHMRDRDDASATASLARVATSPSVVRVPKHFPGASGSLTELTQLLLQRHSRTSRSPRRGRRVLVAVFCGEELATPPPRGGVARPDARPRDDDGDRGAGTYPLSRLLHRCL